MHENGKCHEYRVAPRLVTLVRASSVEFSDALLNEMSELIWQVPIPVLIHDYDLLVPSK